MKTSFLPLLLLPLLFALGCSKDDATPTPLPEPEPSSLQVGLIFHTPFTGNADDVSTAARSGTVTGATVVTGRNGELNGAYAFDGDDYINYGKAPELGLGGFMPYTMTAWVKPVVDSTATRNVITKFDGGVSAGWYMQVNKTNYRAYRNVAPWSVRGLSDLRSNEYVHLATTYDGAILNVYVNGVLDGSRPFTSHPNDTRTDVLVGASHSRGQIVPSFVGEIDEIRIYNRVLTADELTYLASN